MKRNLALLLIGFFLLASCKSVLDKKIGKEDFNEIKDLISKSDTLKELKKKFILDKLSVYVGAAELGKAVSPNSKEIPSFREIISDLSTEYNDKEKISKFITLLSAKAIPISEYDGYLGMTLRFNNSFPKDILYIGINYKFVNKYDSEFFNESTKITDEITKDFKGTVSVMTHEKYNDVAKFMYSNVSEDTVKNKKELMEGLRVMPLLIVFKDKSQIEYSVQDEQYFKK